MTNIRFFLLLFLLPALFIFSETDDTTDSMTKVPQIGIIDVISDSFDASERSMFTDILRTEVFKMHYFTIVERGMIQQVLSEHEIALSGLTDDSQLLKIGEFLSVEKLLVCKIETFADSIVINLRVIDVNTSLLDYTENSFISDKNQVFQALSDLAVQLQIHYLSNSGALTPEKKRDLITQNWTFLGADEEDIQYLIQENVEPSSYLAIRQYDITFTVKDYIEIRKKGWDINIIKDFFREGISFDKVEEALLLGVGDLKNFQEYFKPEGLSFTDYLDAYKNHIVSPEQYLEFQKGYNKDYLSLGLGGVANSLPVMNAPFKFFIAKAGWEHFISDFQRDTMKYSVEMGANFMQGYIPSPYFQFSYYLGKHPFYAKATVGALAEVLVGGHYGMYASLGMELNSSFEFTVMGTFLGTQPRISYADFETAYGDPEYVDIEFPYFGVFLSYKMGDFSYFR